MIVGDQDADHRVAAARGAGHERNRHLEPGAPPGPGLDRQLATERRHALTDDDGPCRCVASSVSVRRPSNSNPRPSSSMHSNSRPAPGEARRVLRSHHYASGCSRAPPAESGASRAVWLERRRHRRSPSRSAPRLVAGGRSGRPCRRQLATRSFAAAPEPAQSHLFGEVADVPDLLAQQLLDGADIRGDSVRWSRHVHAPSRALRAAALSVWIGPSCISRARPAAARSPRRGDAACAAPTAAARPARCRAPAAAQIAPTSRVRCQPAGSSRMRRPFQSGSMRTSTDRMLWQRCLDVNSVGRGMWVPAGARRFHRVRSPERPSREASSMPYQL